MVTPETPWQPRTAALPSQAACLHSTARCSRRCFLLLCPLLCQSNLRSRAKRCAVGVASGGLQPPRHAKLWWVQVRVGPGQLRKCQMSDPIKHSVTCKLVQ
jgi:hypothetical protein